MSKGPSRPMFGKIDPFCLLAVLPMLLVAGIAGAMAGVLAGLVFVAFAGLILLFDSWANRPDPAPPRRPARPRPRTAPARPAPARRPRPPALRPGAVRQVPHPR